jgi:hypothetical protein
MIFGLMDGAKENIKIIARAIKNLSILSDWARPIVLGAHSWKNCIWNYFHDLQCSKVKSQYFEFFRYIFCDMENLTSNARIWTRSALSRRTVVSRPWGNYVGRMCLHV